jgi:hypothetical protein
MAFSRSLSGLLTICSELQTVQILACMKQPSGGLDRRVPNLSWRTTEAYASPRGRIWTLQHALPLHYPASFLWAAIAPVPREQPVMSVRIFSRILIFPMLRLMALL